MERELCELFNSFNSTDNSTRQILQQELATGQNENTFIGVFKNQLTLD